MHTILTREQIEQALTPFREWLERAKRSPSLADESDWSRGFGSALVAVEVELDVSLLAHGAPTAPKEQ